MFKYNAALLKKIEDIYEESGYSVRYEKGNFNNGYCVLESKRVVVINKFHDIEAKINSLMEILTEINVVPEALTEDTRNLYLKILSSKAETLFG
ncbi:MAG: hypothetical protein M9931_11300 [Chitinophagales bacterium]|nr:hypothetical protein [Chitinophagales bacterium]MCO5281619.1 hypothetical protein [Chitinophagales bacterium]OJV27754.1 MAG: hypothetical protein BGO32_10865 [Bacteroidetes bacterium 37-13]HRN93466.1 hypothetical protein [Chitinophagales bacterium]HRP38482.1 hypothetical protein [Chitinophagales bacterium]